MILLAASARERTISPKGKRLEEHPATRTGGAHSYKLSFFILNLPPIHGSASFHAWLVWLCRTLPSLAPPSSEKVTVCSCQKEGGSLHLLVIFPLGYDLSRPSYNPPTIARPYPQTWLSRSGYLGSSLYAIALLGKIVDPSIGPFPPRLVVSTSKAGLSYRLSRLPPPLLGRYLPFGSRSTPTLDPTQHWTCFVKSVSPSYCFAPSQSFHLSRTKE